MARQQNQRSDDSDEPTPEDVAVVEKALRSTVQQSNAWDDLVTEATLERQRGAVDSPDSEDSDDTEV